MKYLRIIILLLVVTPLYAKVRVADDIAAWNDAFVVIADIGVIGSAATDSCIDMNADGIIDPRMLLHSRYSVMDGWFSTYDWDGDSMYLSPGAGGGGYDWLDSALANAGFGLKINATNDSLEIDSNDIAMWPLWTQAYDSVDAWDDKVNTAYDWGDHSLMGYLTGNETITLSGDATGSGTTAITVAVVDDSHNHIYSNIDATTSANWDDQVTDETGTGGAWVFANSPSITSPTIVTSINLPSNAVDASGELASNVIDSTKVVANSLSMSGDMHAFSSADILGQCSNETGTGVLVFGTSPTFTTGITVPDNSISDEELDEGANFTWTGVHDFGGASSAEIPNGTNPTVDAEGELAWETDDDDLHMYDGSADVVIASRKKTRSFVITAPDNTYDFPFWQTPRAITIIGVSAICIDGTNVIGCLDEWTASASAVDGPVDSDWTITTSEYTDASFSNATLDAGDWLGWHTTSVSGSVSFFCITVDYYEQ
jgi:hypothetical protein